MARAKRGRGRARPRKQTVHANGRHLQSVVQETPDDRPWTVFGVDFGTRMWSASYGKKMPGQLLEFMDLQPFWFDEEASTVGQMVASFYQGIFRFGNALYKKGPEAVPTESLITGFKLMLYDKYGTCSQVKRVERQLHEAGIPYATLLELVLGRIWEAICSSAEVRAVEMEMDRTVLYLPVPLLAKEEATETMAQAAKAAGLPRVRFVYEPLCAGVSILKALVRDKLTEHAYQPYRGCDIQSCDMGGGTTDIVTLRLPDSLEDMKRNRAYQLGVDGIRCGATDVDECFVIWLLDKIERRAGGMKRLEAKLLLGRDQIIAQAVLKFQELKKHPDNDTLIIDDSRMQFRQRKEFCMTMELIHSFFDPSIDKIIDAQQRNLTASTKYIIISGGLAESLYVYTRMKQHFASLQVDIKKSTVLYQNCPVATGALMIDDRLDQSSTTSNQTVGLLYEDEDLDFEDHPDAFDENGNPDLDFVFDDSLYTHSRKKPSDVVHDRIRWLIPKGSKADATGHFTTTKSVIQQFHLRVDNPVVTHTVVLATKDSTKDHEPLKDKEGKVLPGFYVYKQSIKLSDAFIRRAVRHGRQWIDIDGIKTLEIWCAVNLRYNNMRIEIIRRVVKPESVAHCDEEDWMDEAEQDFTYDRGHWEEIYDANYDVEIIDTRLPNEELHDQQHEAHPTASSSRAMPTPDQAPTTPMSTASVNTTRDRRRRRAAAEDRDVTARKRTRLSLKQEEHELAELAIDAMSRFAVF